MSPTFCMAYLLSIPTHLIRLPAESHQAAGRSAPDPGLVAERESAIILSASDAQSTYKVLSVKEFDYYRITPHHEIASMMWG
jgi:hypothetical protein